MAMDEALLRRVRRVRHMREVALGSERRRAQETLEQGRRQYGRAREQVEAAQIERAEAAALAKQGVMPARELRTQMEYEADLLRTEHALGKQARRLHSTVRQAEGRLERVTMIRRNAERRRRKIDHVADKLKKRRLLDSERSDEASRDELAVGDSRANHAQSRR